jgi:GDPmannose 4,6-dehydratase
LKALITGITGQDGSFLSELLLSLGYEVHGIIRRSSSFNTGRIDHIYDQLHLHYGDVTDASAVTKTVLDVQPDEIYNLAAQSHVRVSFDMPSYSVDSVVQGTLNILEAARQLKLWKDVKVYQASSSEMFGGALPPQNEKTTFDPLSPYACAKVCAYHLVRQYRDSYGLHASNGILFNHESERRGETFVTRKITKAVARIVAGQQKELRLGNLDASRDWGYAKDYVGAMYLMLQQRTPDDYVVATGETHTVRDFLQYAFDYVGLDWRQYVVFDKRYTRPSEVNCLLGDPSKAKAKLGWVPATRCQKLAELMVEHDLQEVGNVAVERWRWDA